MKQAIIYKNEFGGVTLTWPTGELPIEQVLIKDCPPGAVIVDADTLPQNHDFFNAWEMDGNNVKVSIEKAKEITRQRIRNERAPLLAVQDVAFQRALETNIDAAPIVVEKQRLRDLTKLVDAAATLDELRALKP
jgi:hypothetical protein